MQVDDPEAHIVAVFDAHVESHDVCKECDGYGIPEPVYLRGRWHKHTLPCDECDGTGWIKKEVQ